MGEIADDMIAQMWDHPFEDEDRLGFLYSGGYRYSRRTPSAPPEYKAVCSRCGKKLMLKLSGLDYARFDRKSGKPHRCKLVAKLNEFPLVEAAPPEAPADDNDDEKWW